MRPEGRPDRLAALRRTVVMALNTHRPPTLAVRAVTRVLSSFAAEALAKA